MDLNFVHLGAYGQFSMLFDWEADPSAKLLVGLLGVTWEGQNLDQNHRTAIHVLRSAPHVCFPARATLSHAACVLGGTNSKRAWEALFLELWGEIIYGSTRAIPTETFPTSPPTCCHVTLGASFSYLHTSAWWVLTSFWEHFALRCNFRRYITPSWSEKKVGVHYLWRCLTITYSSPWIVRNMENISYLDKYWAVHFEIIEKK